MTKVTILGKEPKEKELKKIVFIKGVTLKIDDEDRLFEPVVKPYEYKKITCIKSFDESIHDLFICENDYGYNHIYLGHFNDGIV